MDDVADAGKKIDGGGCFTAGTLVATESGYKCIEDVQAGDYVWSENPETRDIVLKRVEETYLRFKKEIIIIYAGNDIIETTSEHPFYVEEIGWIEAGQLESGNVLRLKNGTNLEIREIKIERNEEYVPVYNLNVEDYDTYFVGEEQILVHNANCAMDSNTDYEFDEAVKNGTKAITSADDYAKAVKNRTKVLGAYSSSESASDILKQELNNSGILFPPYKFATHHIVPKNMDAAKKAREILDNFDIDYDSAVNGVFLPMEYNKYTTNETLHIGRHTDNYCNEVVNRLEKTYINGAKKDDIIEVLNKIRADLLNGKIKLN